MSHKYLQEEKEGLDTDEDEDLDTDEDEDLDTDEDEDLDMDTDIDYDSEEDPNNGLTFNKKEEREEGEQEEQEEDQFAKYSVDQKDLFLRNLEDQINKKKQIIFSKRRFLDETKKDNEYLEGVRKDYEKYRKYIAHSKKQELDAMLMLKSYVDDIILNGNLINADINNAKLEKARIIKEIKKIKRALDEIVALR
jgi:hypothetical protein